tara:strand:- start:489 stop:674 length:186 start_codon:yes stop_codon:yes gene_type:complete
MIVVLIDDVNTYQEVYFLINIRDIQAMQQNSTISLHFLGKIKAGTGLFLNEMVSYSLAMHH